ncbi:unnamed protein product [Sphagnum troendelagicum]|uniref:Uncharacterized protein n=1 Tax=Sphagnum troendelagicum TaxID=128251 RepID=A0ABP0THD4_9BRYO
MYRESLEMATASWLEHSRRRRKRGQETRWEAGLQFQVRYRFGCSSRFGIGSGKWYGERKRKFAVANREAEKNLDWTFDITAFFYSFRTRRSKLINGGPQIRVPTVLKTAYNRGSRKFREPILICISQQI